MPTSKKLYLLAVAVCVGLLATPAIPTQAQVIVDLSVVTCGQYMGKDRDTQDVLAAWMSGYFNAAKDPAHIRGALDYVASPTYWKQINIEEESYIPITLFRYGRSEVAYKVLADLSNPQKKRREYPEVSYSVIEAIVSGVMGIALGHSDDNFDVSTLSRLPADSDHATLTSVSLRNNQLNVTHTGTSTTRLKNNSGPALRWRAEFPGISPYLSIDGKRIAAEHAVTAEGVPISWADVGVPPGAAIVVSK